MKMLTAEDFYKARAKMERTAVRLILQDGNPASAVLFYANAMACDPVWLRAFVINNIRSRKRKELFKAATTKNPEELLK